MPSIGEEEASYDSKPDRPPRWHQAGSTLPCRTQSHCGFSAGIPK
ncbi:hypothetical protein GbCGDNIH2_7048 [Granulibacter bethesdensis]|uniref:Uncharacterized protein n=1 Tax=Granulibacter bethesdensis (strain ATCC BAA-1260 / CGDNIH1) TaxID=391165 RepID=A0A286M2X8_GRABC|nr:hypothetical protein GbCGDNIH2_7048 [Granulibacter bethesdensis]APH51345.1 hypothetical protein GbCGDNIH5_7048 [Granulibacter bethesdensis]APH64038.1 hypothetical protein GbCGDNIH1I4_7048 [Granulibacter bethesdensis]ASV62377.1 hypothetical protein GbCGDNIH1_7048 [Granulibacter bethesdensis CGDNIH1]